MKRFTIPLLLTVAALATLAAAPAVAGRGHAAGFPAACHFTGTVTFNPPLTNTARPGSASARARGTCDGRPATYVARNSGVMSCGEGSATGGGVLRVKHRRKLRFRLSEQRAGGVAALHLEGRRGRTAEGVASISPSEDPVAIAQACLAPGLSSVKIDIDVRATP